MLQGQSLQSLAADLDARMAIQRDLVADTSDIRMVHTRVEFDDGIEFKHELIVGKNVFGGNEPTRFGDQANQFGINDNAHSQIAARLKVPKRYYDRMRTDAPELLTESVNKWMGQDDSRRLIRVEGPSVRAFLSDRYRRIENPQIFRACMAGLEPFADQNNLEIKSMQITDKKFYMQVVFPKLEGEPKLNDPVQAGFCLRNSEVGLGALSAIPMVWRLKCLNGMICPENLTGMGLRRSHLGSQLTTDDGFAVFKDDTLKADDEALMLRIRDTIAALSQPELFVKLMEHLKASAESQTVVNPVRAVEELAKVIPVTDNESTKLVENLIRDGDYSKWGMVNAVTALAHNAKSYDRSVEHEELGGKVLSLNLSQWTRIAEAA